MGGIGYKVNMHRKTHEINKPRYVKTAGATKAEMLSRIQANLSKAPTKDKAE